MMQEAVVVIPYDPAWPDRFESERAWLAGVFRGTDAVIEHVGSTAVPGLGAKPIIDIMLGVTDLAEVAARLDRLEAHGYGYVPEYESQLPERRYFRKPESEPRTHHLHCVIRGSDFWVRHLLFRDYLRAHPDSAGVYFELKRELASLYRRDRAAYMEGKSDFIESVLSEAASKGFVGLEGRCEDREASENPNGEPGTGAMSR